MGRECVCVSHTQSPNASLTNYFSAKSLYGVISQTNGLEQRKKKPESKTKNHKKAKGDSLVRQRIQRCKIFLWGFFYITVELHA